jgi:phosphopantetheinyl transferase (holo-ACP synthase)
VTGNDIVDIKIAAAESNWKRKGFLEKIFTLQEQQYLKEAAVPDEMVWKLWTMKESAYKIYTRQHGGRFFAPQKFSCTLFTETTGIVEYDNNSCQTITFTTKDYIYSTARPKKVINAEFMNSCFYLPQTALIRQQQFIYKKIIDRYSSITGEVKKNISIAKDKNGIPFLNGTGNLQIPISVTHHGNYAAFTIH